MSALTRLVQAQIDRQALAGIETERAARMEMMAAVFGADLAALAPEEREAATLSCLRCGADVDCREALLGTPDPAHCGFCPNAGRYAAEAERQRPPG